MAISPAYFPSDWWSAFIQLQQNEKPHPLYKRSMGGKIGRMEDTLSEEIQCKQQYALYLSPSTVSRHDLFTTREQVSDVRIHIYCLRMCLSVCLLAPLLIEPLDLWP